MSVFRMIDSLIWSFNLKVMNFLIFRDFSRIFLNFFMNLIQFFLN